MKKLLLPTCFLAFLLAVPPSSACTIPVFRFALERWDLGIHDVLIYHRGPLPADVKAAIKHWADPPARANIEITTIDLDGKMSPYHAKLWQSAGLKDVSVAMIVPSLPSSEGAKPIAWSGPFTPANLENLVVSPVRQVILAHLLRGATAVNVLLTSDDAAKDQQAFAMLTRQLPILEREIKLPVQNDEPASRLRWPLPLKIGLPLIVLDRNDPREAEFIRLLLATEQDLDKVKGPILFPIYGRGRVLASLSGGELTKEMVFDTTSFLCRSCSCEIKAANPGVDLLLAANWNEIVDRMFEGKEALPMPSATYATLPQRLAPANTEAAREETPSVAPTPSQEPAPSPVIEADPTQTPCGCNLQLWLWIATGAAGALVLGSGSWLLYRLRN